MGKCGSPRGHLAAGPTLVLRAAALAAVLGSLPACGPAADPASHPGAASNGATASPGAPGAGGASVRAADAPRPEVVVTVPVVADTRDLPGTSVLAHPDEPVVPGRSALWTAAFQATWDELRRETGGVVPRVDTTGDGARVRLLNSGELPAETLDPDDIVLGAGRSAAGALSEARLRLHERFRVGLPPRPSLPDDALVLYAFLRKHIAFDEPFEPAPVPIVFPRCERRVPAFGILPSTTNPNARQARGQVTVLQEEYERPGDTYPSSFVLELRLAGGRERLVLASPAEGETLAAKWASVGEATRRGTRRPLAASDILVIPKFDFSLTHRFEDLLNVPYHGAKVSGTIHVSRQILEFRLDEGAPHPVSHPLVAVTGAPRGFVLHSPFLLALERTGAGHPYLLAWIANDELLAHGRE
jgi:hypothetical protein